MTGSQPIVFTRDEIAALHTYSHTQSTARTYRVQRDTHNVLVVIEPDGRLTRLSPPSEAA